VGGKTGPKAEKILAAKSFAALAEGDYVKAGSAARLLLARNPQSLQGLLASAVSSAWLGEGEETSRALAAIRLDLSSRRFEAADRWAEILLRSSPPAHVIVQLAAFYELSRQLDQAARFYRQALARAFYPDACLGLARVAAERGDTAAARRHTLEALNFRQPLGKHATPPLELLRLALTQLALLEPPIKSGRAWTAALPDNALPAPLAGMSFIVYASSQPQAEHYFQTVIEGMRLLPQTA
jgi:tetratricopeptide (TPR) repeat protein